MKLFLDTAIVDDIASRNDGLISGVTTNPTLIAASGRDPDEVYREILNLGIEDLSIEVKGEYFDELMSNSILAERSFGTRATIKLPCTPDGLKVCKYLTGKGTRVNMTLVFSVSQAILCALAGATYISPFVGRLDDNGHDGVGLIREIATIYCHENVKTKILAASIRYARSVGEAFKAGAHICTVPPKVYDDMFKHVLTDKGFFQFLQDFDRNL
jgi:transaldolase